MRLKVAKMFKDQHMLVRLQPSIKKKNSLIPTLEGYWLNPAYDVTHHYKTITTSTKTPKRFTYFRTILNIFKNISIFFHTSALQNRKRTV